MALSPQLELRQRTRLVQSSTLYTGMAVLALPLADLTGYLNALANENPFLDVTPPTGGPIGAPQDTIDSIRHQPSLLEHLAGQILTTQATQEVQEAALQIAGMLDHFGLLRESPTDIAADLALDPQAIGPALAILRRCDPVGVAQPDVTSALALHLARDGVPETLIRPLIEAAIDHTQTAQDLGVSRQDFDRYMAQLRVLPPYPAWGFADQTPQTIRPDLEVTLDPQGIPVVHHLTAWTPKAALSPHTTQTATFGRDLTTQAEAILRALAFRTDTILRIGQAVVAHQHAFFSRDPKPLSPLSRQEISTTLSLHGSTIGRAVAAKHLLWNGRTYPLSYFFSAAVQQRNAPPVSAHHVMVEIAKLIRHEPAEKPLSDAALQRMLSQTGVDIARRTIAKYRQCLKIPSSPERRRRKAQGR